MELGALAVTALLCYSVRSRVFSEAAEGEAVTWMRQLEEEEAISPLWEVFFQLAAYPVPQVPPHPPTPPLAKHHCTYMWHSFWH